MKQNGMAYLFDSFGNKVGACIDNPGAIITAFRECDAYAVCPSYGTLERRQSYIDRNQNVNCIPSGLVYYSSFQRALIARFECTYGPDWRGILSFVSDNMFVRKALALDVFSLAEADELFGKVKELLV